jgi:beta-lactamase superfamily II metal-dependent hydrolase
MGKKWLYHLKQISSNNIEITRDPLFDAAFEGFLLNNEKNIEFKQENISYSSEDLNWLDKYAEYKDIEMDSKITNCSSIALLIDYKDIKMLFPGDSPIQLFENELPEILDIIKLPHHGSAKNISLEFIKNTKVKYYLLSTDGKRYIDHPGKAVIANIIKNTGNNTELIKNYEIKFLKGLGKLDAED